MTREILSKTNVLVQNAVGFVVFLCILFELKLKFEEFKLKFEICIVLI